MREADGGDGVYVCGVAIGRVVVVMVCMCVWEAVMSQMQSSRCLRGSYPGVSYEGNRRCCVTLGVVCVYVYLGQAMGSVVRDIGVRCMVEMADALEKQRPQVLAT